MTREEAIKWLNTIPTIGEQVDALEMAIKALEKERSQLCYTQGKMEGGIMAHWIEYGNDKAGYSLRCSACGEDFGDTLWLEKYWYCPNCGEPMEQERR